MNFATFLFAVLAMSGLGNPGNGSIDSGPVIQTLDEFVGKLDRFSGVVLVKQGEEIVHLQGYGCINPDPNLPPESCKPLPSDARFEIASVSKMFTAASVLIAAKDGQLSLDDPLSKYFPDVPEGYKEVTIDHLLRHKGGLRAGLVGEDLSPDLAVKATLAVKPLFRAGEGYAYSNAGYSILALIVERVSGMPFQKYCHSRIFAPAKMTATGFCGEEIADTVVAMGYDHICGSSRRADIDPYQLPKVFGYSYGPYTCGPGCVVTNVRDLSNWVSYLGSPEFPTDVRDRMFKLEFGRTRGAYGWEVKQERGLLTRAHSGSVSGFRSNLVWFPDKDILIVALANRDDVDQEQFEAIRTIVVPAPGEISRRVKFMPDGPGELSPDELGRAIVTGLAAGEAWLVTSYQADSIPKNWGARLGPVWRSHVEKYGGYKSVSVTSSEKVDSGRWVVRMDLVHEKGTAKAVLELNENGKIVRFALE